MERTREDIEKEMLQLRECNRENQAQIGSLMHERQEWIEFANADKEKIRKLEAALLAAHDLLNVYLTGGK